MLEIKKQFCLYNFSYDRPTINIGMVERGKYKITKQNKTKKQNCPQGYNIMERNKGKKRMKKKRIDI